MSKNSEKIQHIASANLVSGSSIVASDMDIIDSILNGDIGRFEILMRRYNNRLYRVARGLLNDPDEAMDVVQESWIAAFNALDTFRGPVGFAAWVSRITHNNALMRIRKSAPIDYQEETMLETLNNEDQQSPSAIDDIAKQQLGVVLERAVNNLPIKYKSVFVLRAIEHLSTKETAASLDLQESAVKQRYLRAKRMMQVGLLSQIEDSGVTIWEFAGKRCDQIVAGVFSEILHK